MACNGTNYKFTLASFKDTVNAICLRFDLCSLVFVDSFFPLWLLNVRDF